MEQLSGVMIIVIIGGGVLTFVTLFIFAKRQIMRFTIRSRRGPHVPVGTDTKKSIRQEIERRLDSVQKIAYEPKLIWEDDKFIVRPDQPLKPYYWRMRAVDDVKILEKEIAKSDGSTRHPHDSLRAFLLVTLTGALNGNGQRLIHQFCDMYEHARHDPNEFGSEEYEAYHRLLMKLIDSARVLKSIVNSRKTSPSRTPLKKQTKGHSLIDPLRLRPPQLHTSAGSLSATGPKTSSSENQQTQYHSRSSLTLGLQPEGSMKREQPQDFNSSVVFGKGSTSYLGLRKDSKSYLGLQRSSSSSLTRQDDNESVKETKPIIHRENSFSYDQAEAGSSTLECKKCDAELQDDESSDEDEIISITRYTEGLSNAN